MLSAILLITLLALLIVRLVVLDAQVDRQVGVRDGNVAFAFDGGRRRRFDSYDAVGRQGRVDRVHVIFLWQNVLANEMTRDGAVAVVSLLVLALDDDRVVDRLHRDLRRLEVVHVHAGLEAVFAEVEILLVLGQLVRGFAGDGPWTTVAGRQVMSAGTWNDSVGLEVARQKPQPETWFQACKQSKGETKGTK